MISQPERLFATVNKHTQTYTQKHGLTWLVIKYEWDLSVDMQCCSYSVGCWLKNFCWHLWMVVSTLSQN